LSRAAAGGLRGAVAAAEDAQRGGLVDRRGHGLDLQTAGLQLLEHVLRDEPSLLGNLVNTFIHICPV
jgi:hypothetical protein